MRRAASAEGPPPWPVRAGRPTSSHLGAAVGGKGHQQVVGGLLCAGCGWGKSGTPFCVRLATLCLRACAWLCVFCDYWFGKTPSSVQQVGALSNAARHPSWSACCPLLAAMRSRNVTFIPHDALGVIHCSTRTLPSRSQAGLEGQRPAQAQAQAAGTTSVASHAQTLQLGQTWHGPKVSRYAVMAQHINSTVTDQRRRSAECNTFQNIPTHADVGR